MKLPRLALLTLASALLLALAACSTPTGNNEDPYQDPGTDPPPPITDPTVRPAGAVSPKPGSADLIEVNVTGVSDPSASGFSTLSGHTSLSEDDFTVVEDGVVQGITVERIGEGGTRAAADVVFVFDTTGSMGSALSSVQDSIVSFAQFLDDSGLNVRVGAVTFGDAFDTIDEGSSRNGSGGDQPPSFDSDERPTFDLSDDVAAFTTFIEEDSPRSGGNAPENAVGALEFAYDNLSWRSGAQRVIIVITDVYAHNPDTYENEFMGPISGRWIPSDPDDLLGRLQGNAVVHVVGPDLGDSVGQYTDMRMFTGAAGTGGVFVPFSTGAEFDLSDLPIAEAAAGGYLLTFRGTVDGEEKEIRVVLDDGSDIRGEFTTTATY